MLSIFKRIILISSLAVTIFSCTKNFTEKNTNPTVVSTTSPAALFNGILSSLPVNYYEQMFLYNDMCTLYAQLATLPNQGYVNLDNLKLGAQDIWNRYYNSMANVRQLQTLLAQWPDQAIVVNQKAMLKVINAYETFRMTDLFGDMPYSQAGYAFSTTNRNIYPKYDLQQSVYDSLLADLKWVNDSSTTNATDPAGNAYLDFGTPETIVYSAVNGNSNMLMYVKFANALRLRYALRMSAKDPADAKTIIQDVVGNNEPLPLPGDDFALYPAKIFGWNNDNINTAFRNDLSGTGLRMGSTIWAMLSNGGGNNSSNIVDPRTYIFFSNIDSTNQWLPIPQTAVQTPEAGDPYTDPTKFGTYSPVNLDLVGRSPAHLNPQPFITAAEVQFLLAEIYARSDLGLQNLASAQTAYTLGVQTSINFWYGVAAADAAWIPQPAAVTPAEIATYLASPQALWNAANPLPLIYAQRWLDLFREPWEAYSLARSTQNMTPGGVLPATSPVFNWNRIPYPTDEADNNPVNYNAELALLGGTDDITHKVWWMP